MKTTLKMILWAIGVAALLVFPAMAKAQTGTVTALTATPLAGNNAFTDLGHGLQVATVCHDGGAVLIAFQNIGSEPATLNFLFSDGTTVTANGLVLQPGFGEFDAHFFNKRIEGQFIFANTAGNTTVSLHAFDAGTFCETRGTVQFGPNPPAS